MSSVLPPDPLSSMDILTWGHVSMRTGARTSWDFSCRLFHLSHEADRHDASLMWMARIAYRMRYADAHPDGPQLLVRGALQR